MLSSWALSSSIITLIMRSLRQFSFKTSSMRSDHWWFSSSLNSWLRYTSWTNSTSESVTKLWVWNMSLFSAVCLIISNPKAATTLISSHSVTHQLPLPPLQQSSLPPVWHCSQLWSPQPSAIIFLPHLTAMSNHHWMKLRNSIVVTTTCAFTAEDQIID